MQFKILSPVMDRQVSACLAAVESIAAQIGDYDSACCQELDRMAHIEKSRRYEIMARVVTLLVESGKI